MNDTADDEQPPEYARGGLILGPDGEDSIPVFLHQGEHWYTAEQARRFIVVKTFLLDPRKRGKDKPGA